MCLFNPSLNIQMHGHIQSAGSCLIRLTYFPLQQHECLFKTSRHNFLAYCLYSKNIVKHHKPSLYVLCFSPAQLMCFSSQGRVHLNLCKLSRGKSPVFSSRDNDVCSASFLAKSHRSFFCVFSENILSFFVVEMELGILRRNSFAVRHVTHVQNNQVPS